MIQSAEVQAKIASIRQKMLDNSITKEELIHAVALMRGDRRKAAESSTTAKRAKAKKEIPNANDLLSELLP